MESVAIPPVRLANVVAGAAPLGADERGVNETYVGLIQTASEQIRAYIKVLGGKQLVNELICSTLGRAVGLPVPEGFLVRANASDLPESAALASHSGDAQIFASSDAGFPSLKRRLAQDRGDFLKEIFLQWKDLDAATIFDEWIANVDRHPGNLLVETASRVWLIDHGHSLTGPDWKESDMRHDAVVRNRLADAYFNNMTLPQRMEVREKAARSSESYKLLDADAVLSACHSDNLLSANDIKAVKTFIELRAIKVIDLISSRLGIPNMEVRDA